VTHRDNNALLLGNLAANIAISDMSLKLDFFATFLSQSV